MLVQKKNRAKSPASNSNDLAQIDHEYAKYDDIGRILKYLIGLLFESRNVDSKAVLSSVPQLTKSLQTSDFLSASTW